ncbi:MAG TPA: ankyrin repeat domain-containing protein [Gemmatimonadaceae bacterium]|nr:ankyrin repeat domain-containing protein [Gemmatimonadaceae bacterium]
MTSFGPNVRTPAVTKEASMTAPFRRSLPPHADLGQQRTLAKELLRAFHAGDPEARTRVRAALPDKPTIKLADAQFALAREYGFASWGDLKRALDARPLQRLRDAVQAGDAAAMRALLSRHAGLRATINAPLFSFDSPAIVHAASRGDVPTIDVLLEFGADPNRRSDWWAGGFHALHSVRGGEAADRLLAAGAVPDACAAAHLDRPELLERLLAEDPARAHERGGDGQTPLHFARSRAVADLLLAASADVDARDVDHRATPAQWMLERRRGAGRYELARYLVVERGAAADIFLAAALGLADRVRAMLDADPSLLRLLTGQGEYGERPPSSYHIYTWTIGASLTPLEVAAQFEQPEALAAMRGFASPTRRFVSACMTGDEEGARALARAQPGVVRSLAADEQRALPHAAWHGNARTVALMLELGFDPTVPGHDGGTALHCAAWQGSAASVAAILRHPDARSLVALRDAFYGATPLGWCCHGSLHGNPAGQHAEVARLLLAAGATPGPDSEHASEAVRTAIDAWMVERQR